MPTIEEILKQDPTLKREETPTGTLLAGERTPTGQRREVFVPKPPTPQPPTIDEVAGTTPTTPPLTIPTGTDLDKFVREARERARITAEGEIDEEKIREQARKRIQAEIDALNRIYEERQARLERREAGELGTAAAIQARRGLAGSPFAEAQRAEVVETAEERERALEAEKALAVASITDKANELAERQKREEQEAYTKSTSDYLKFIEFEEQRKESRLSELAKIIIAKGLTADTLSPEDITGIENAGFSLDDVRRAIVEQTEEKELETEIVESGGRKLLINSQTGETIKDLGEATGDEKRSIIKRGGRQILIDSISGEDIKDLGEVSEKETLQEEKLRLDIANARKKLKEEGTDLTPKQTQTALAIIGKLQTDPIYKDMLDIQTGLIGVDNGLRQENGFGDIAAINAFQRMIDPGATVREGDIVLIEKANSFLEQLDPEFQIKKLKEGDRLPQATRKRMKELSKELYEARRKNYNDLSGEKYKKLSQGAGIDFEFVGSEFKTVEEIIFEEGKVGGEEKPQEIDVNGEIWVLQPDGTYLPK